MKDDPDAVLSLSEQTGERVESDSSSWEDFATWRNVHVRPSAMLEAILSRERNGNYHWLLRQRTAMR